MRAADREEKPFSTCIATRLSVLILSSPCFPSRRPSNEARQNRMAATSFTLMCWEWSAREKNPAAGTSWLRWPPHPHGDASVVSSPAVGCQSARPTSELPFRWANHVRSSIAPWLSRTVRVVVLPPPWQS